MASFRGTQRELGDTLDRLYRKYNRRVHVHPDPVEYLYHYERVEDREIAGMIASSLAYGRVAQICCSVSRVLEKMNPSPARFLEEADHEALRAAVSDFKHRFTTATDMAELLIGMKEFLHHHGSFHTFFSKTMDGVGKEGTVLPSLCVFVEELRAGSRIGKNSLLPDPRRGSACKRLNLFLRWMVRRDRVDPGGWHDISPSRLIVPLDTHMHRLCLDLGLTTRVQADMKTALEVTEAFRRITPGDPARFDFALTRLGMRKEIEFLWKTDRDSCSRTDIPGARY
ncbi:MAG: TIGR02757 family protein [Deltaproteobacteria bacterium]|nr:TIGR02757 family protein [Deltaproteobacteria bacterium]